MTSTLMAQMKDSIEEYLRVRQDLMVFENQHRDVLDQHAAMRQRADELSRMFAPGDDGMPLLSTRQLEVMRMLADGKNNEEIGKALFIAPDTVRTHVRTAFRRLGATTRGQAVAEAFRKGLLT